MNLDATNWVGAISAAPREALCSYKANIGIIGGCFRGKFRQMDGSSDEVETIAVQAGDCCVSNRKLSKLRPSSRR